MGSASLQSAGFEAGSAFEIAPGDRRFGPQLLRGFGLLTIAFGVWRAQPVFVGRPDRVLVMRPVSPRWLLPVLRQRR
jgi:hypothetical protein